MYNSQHAATTHTHFIDHGVSEGLLVPSGGFAVVHLHGHQADPRLLLFGGVVVLLPFSSTHLRLLVSDL